MKTVAKLVAPLVLLGIVAGCGGDRDDGGSTPTTAGPSTTATGAVSAQAPDVLAKIDPATRQYVDAVARADLDALVASFADDATVIDVNREIRGRAAIRGWADNEVIGGQLTVLRATPHTNGTTMLVRFRPGGTGGFDANYVFDVANGLIIKATLSYA